MAVAAVALSGCDDRSADNSANAVPGNETVIVEDNDALGNGTTSNGADALPALVPPAPGEVGGLPDDREPLDESPIAPTSVRGAGSVVERYAVAIEQQRFADAYRLWRDNGAGSGMSATQFAQNWSRYRDVRILIGRPQTGGTQTAIVPVQIYGRVAATTRPFNQIGTMTLARNPDGQQAGSSASPWLIAHADLKAIGIVREEGSTASPEATAVIPDAFRGRWARNANACTAPGDTGELVITSTELRFYESSGRVTKVTPQGTGIIDISARYSGEGQDWTAERRLEVSPDGRTLTADDMTRVRCG